MAVRHFGSRSFLLLPSAGGGTQLAVQGTEEGTVEDSILVWLLVAAASAGVGARVLLACLCCWWCAHSDPSHQGRRTNGVATRWESIVLHALRFIRRRRRIASALQQSQGVAAPHSSDPTTVFKPSTPTPQGRCAEPLREGPAVSHGAHSGRAEAD